MINKPKIIPMVLPEDVPVNLKPILASGSEIRGTLLRNAGLDFDSMVARIDEESVKESLRHEGARPRDIADALAEYKARRVSGKYPDRIVIGCDQVLDLDGTVLSKATSAEHLKRQLFELSGKSHKLFSAVVIYEDAEPVWRYIGQATLTMYDHSINSINQYVDDHWEKVKWCVGGYQIEQEGVRLFSRIQGDYFSILGLPLMELLGFLRQRGALSQ